MAKKWYSDVEVESDVDLMNHAVYLPGPTGAGDWIFRGLPRDYPLKTTLERALLDAHGSLENALQVEKYLLKEFKRRAHHYLRCYPVTKIS